MSLAVCGGCDRRSDVPFSALDDEFVYTALSFSPVGATAQGYHVHQGVSLDGQLDDVSRQTVDRQRNWYSSFHQRIAAVDKEQLTAEERADYEVMDNQIGLSLFEIDLAQSWRHNPALYVELLGNALFNPYMLEYAPKEERARHIIARLEKLPTFLDQTKKNLYGAPAVWIRVAREENQGTVGLVDKTLREFMPEELKEAYNKAAIPAMVELQGFDKFLELELPQRQQEKAKPDWRLGPDKYKVKFRFALGTDRTPTQVLAQAEADVKQVRGQMADLAKQVLAAHSQPVDADAGKAIQAALTVIGQRRSTAATYMDDAKADLAEAREFVRQKNFLNLPKRDNLQVIETPVFMRGVYGVGGFNPAPALEPKLGAFYWVTPIPAEWDKARVDSKLGEYNFYKLKLLTIHEAMPGHYVQGEFANDLQPKARRVLRSVFGNTPNVEGWAQYATQTMLDQGFLNGSPELRMTFLKEELRVLANAILDIRLQSNSMTEQEAMDLTEKQTFQEHEEAVAKLQRAQLSSAQLPAYLVGWRDWIRVRDRYKQLKPGTLRDFHDAALKEGAVPLPVLFQLLTGKPLAE